MGRENRRRLLKAEEIEVRIGAIYKDYITLLLYADARTVMEILDEEFGPLGWQRRHIFIDGVMFCEISVKDGEGQWICRSDVGVPSYSEPIKGQASDSFKRASVLFGVSRELYSSPPLIVDINKVTMKEINGKMTVKDRFTVQSITYDEENRVITGIVIVNKNGKVVFQYMASNSAKSTITSEQTAEILNEIKRTGVSLPGVLKKYGLKKISDMSPELYTTAMKTMRDMKDAA